jgi:hypothetical protein
MASPVEWYAEPGPLTRIERNAERIPKLSGDLDELCRLVQGLLVHAHWAQAYGLDRASVRTHECQIRSAQAMLDRILELDDTDLCEARPPERRLVGNCRHFSTFGVALLRAHGVPARARCGFGAYFSPDHLEDHWVVEVWQEGAWHLVDAQIDGLQREVLGLGFDTTDVPRDQFRLAGDVWLACRKGEFDPGKAGIFDMRGLWFVQGNVVRDVASLNKLELLPWDVWGRMDQDVKDPGGLDPIAAATARVGTSTAELRALYDGDPGLRVPPVVTSIVEGKPVEQSWDDSGLDSPG